MHRGGNRQGNMDKPAPSTGSAQVIGHETTLEILDRAVVEGRVRHAYLFAGPAHVGKSTLGRWLALRLNCPGPEAPCGHCPSCRRILEGAHPDVRSLQLPNDRDPTLGIPIETGQRNSRTVERVIGIEQIRALQRDVSLAPHQGRWKVYIITNVETMSLEAANCLLKTLEEPPASSILVLTTGDSLELLPTVLSRCQMIRIGLDPWETIATALTSRWNSPLEQAQLVARLSGGRPGWAIDALTNQDLLEERQQALAILAATLEGTLRERLQVAEKLATYFSRDPGHVLQTLIIWQLWWWDVQLVQRRCHELVTNVDQAERLRSIANSLTSSTVVAYLRQIELAAQRLLQNVNPRLALEALVLASPTAR